MAEQPTVADSTTLMLVTVGRLLSRRVDEELATQGLTLRHLGALGHLSHRPDLSYSDLARRAGVTTQSMHTTVRALEEQGAVERVLAGHGHAARLEITEHGRKLLARVAEAAVRLDEELFGHLSAEQVAGLRAGLIALAASPRRLPL
ncbi:MULTISPECIES: MarR family winged helix-turn-helix transcriptional regulator [unclassified Crossiella]|uniref:MarR family winged helix-turn-helix transcriptional regulator n=1 Tax=unclassified Crossiella TaxID=2620835 RepID=UPI00200041B3|nr:MULTISPECIES: MarR family transcriptional regulator [unclassified Crossiella]MCK2242881.1 MarR family transcriptional regulator [Crossiella sp. S99.2]MCK2256758.1 MarR family transcriptional regulator [Crossiella sp. S99.1]